MVMTESATNIDAREVAKFEELAHRWWDPHSEFKPLHDINPLRLDYIDQRAGLAGKQVLDVGCGGGILSESMARRGARVTGIDAGETPLAVARLHLHESGLEVNYQQCTAEDLARQEAGAFDVVTCLEMLEHVPDPAAVINACARLIREDGRVILSTISRNPKAYLFAVLGAEYLLRLLPRGTHEYARFIRPSEMEAWARESDLQLADLTGMSYNPLTRTYWLGNDVSVNYLACFRRA